MEKAESQSTRGRVGIRATLSAAIATFVALAVQARHHHDPTDGNGRAGKFDYYLLSLSWAPTYCLTHANDGEECSGKGYGFVLHGLWPQYNAGGYPENCATRFELPADAIAKGRVLYPSERLMRHEWRRHGTCSGLDARAYFDTADRATATIKIPTTLEAPRSAQSLTGERIVNLFQGVNPLLPEGAMTVACNRAELAEIRVCLTLDLKPRACGQAIRSNCPRVPLSIPASR